VNKKELISSKESIQLALKETLEENQNVIFEPYQDT
jgi:hypothetical protein